MATTISPLSAVWRCSMTAMSPWKMPTSFMLSPRTESAKHVAARTMSAGHVDYAGEVLVGGDRPAGGHGPEQGQLHDRSLGPVPPQQLEGPRAVLAEPQEAFLLEGLDVVIGALDRDGEALGDLPDGGRVGVFVDIRRDEVEYFLLADS